MVVLAGIVFVADTLTRLEIAVAVFYVAVVLIAIGHFRTRGVVIVSGTCMVLTIISYFLTHTGSTESGPINCLISLVAIAVAARLGLQMVAVKVQALEARAQLAHVSRVTSLGELTASIAHEINQPLAAIMTSGDTGLRWLASQPPNISRARGALERIVDDASRASDVILRVRQLAKRAPPRKESVDLNRALLEIVALTQREAQKNRVLLRTELSQALPSVLIDRVQIQQVILNLLLNAIEVLRSVNGGGRHLLIRSSHEDPNTVVVAIEDNGPGLAPDQLDRVFDAFHSTKPEGLGIGLTISRSIIEAHGGRIWAENFPTGGAAFRFSLPIRGVDEA